MLVVRTKNLSIKSVNKQNENFKLKVTLPLQPVLIDRHLWIVQYLTFLRHVIVGYV